MNQYFSIFSFTLNELKSQLTDLLDVFLRVVFKLEVEVLDVWGQSIGRTPYWYNGFYIVKL